MLTLLRDSYALFSNNELISIFWAVLILFNFWYSLLMIEKFNGIFYLIVFLVHFLIFAVYAYQTVFATKTFLDKFGIDDTGAGMTRFFGSLFIGAVVMAIWVGFIRSDGLQGTWAFFNLVFLQNLSAFCVGFYTIKINKLGHTPQTSNEGIIAPGILTLLSAILCFGLADKIYY